MKFYLYLLGLVFLASACEKTANIDVPEIEAKLAVYGFLTADEILEIKLDELTPLFGKNAKSPGPVSGATVVITCGDSVYLLQESSQGHYYNQKKVEAGKTYSIEVSKAGYKTVRSKCTVPDYVPNNIKLEYLATPDIDQDSNRRFGFKWMDKPGVENYYRVSGYLLIDGFQSDEIYFIERNFSDQNRDGQELFSGLGQSYTFISGTIQSLEVRFNLEVLDVNLYKYMRTFDASRYSDDNPFSEPVIMYSNIENGVGVFGGVNKGTFLKKVYD